MYRDEAIVETFKDNFVALERLQEEASTTAP